MSFESVRSISLPIATDTAISQYHGVYIDTNGQAIQVTDGSAQLAVGIALEARVADTSTVQDEQTVPVALFDGSKMEAVAGLAVAAGDRLIIGDDGQVHPHDAATAGDTPAGTYRFVGVALSAASGAGERVTFLSAPGLGSVTLS